MRMKRNAKIMKNEYMRMKKRNEYDENEEVCDDDEEI